MRSITILAAVSWASATAACAGADGTNGAQDDAQIGSSDTGDPASSSTSDTAGPDDSSATNPTSVSTSFTTSSTGDDSSSGADDDSSGAESGGSTGPAEGCDGLGANGLLLHTTLDDPQSVAAPVVGAGSGTIATNPADDFTPALAGNGIVLDEPGEHVAFPQVIDGVANIDLGQGTIDFCYRPQFDHLDSVAHVFFTAGSDGGRILMRKAGGNNSNTLEVVVTAADGTLGAELAIPSSEYAFVPDAWYRVTISWDFELAPDEQNVRAYLDGVELVDPDPPTGAVTMPAAAADEVVYIGAAAGGNNPSVPGGVIDDFKLYDSALAP